MATIAFCGIDGAGKSTLVAMVRDRLVDEGQDVSALKSDLDGLTAPVLKLGRYACPQHYSGGARGAMYAVSRAVDYRRWFERTGIARDVSEKARITLLDRHAPCYRAFAATIHPSCELTVRWLLRRVPPPDLVFHVVVEPEVAWARKLEKGRPSPDESLEMLRRFHLSYQRLLRKMDGVVHLPNQHPPRIAADAVLRELRARLWIPADTE